MKDNSTIIKKRYFGAQNSYHGFISYFDSIFAPAEYERLFILKGGPGTGKNSFMRGVRDRFITDGFEIEEIYCSSDPASLDGIIIKANKKKIAVIDGTAPHEMDAKLPGAVDEIVNLGQNWDSRWLSAEREKIITLNEQKRDAYKTAYEYLKIGRGAFDFIKDVHKRCFDYASAKKSVEKKLKDTEKAENYEESVRLISAFGKDGLITLDTMDRIAEKKLTVGGNDIDSMLFMECTLQFLKGTGISHQRSPYPLAGDLSEAIYVPHTNFAITKSDARFDIDAEEFSIGISDVEAEKIKKANAMLNDAKDEAVRWFKIASDLHFRLEDIYSKAMSFEENDRLLAKTVSEIEIIFDNSK